MKNIILSENGTEKTFNGVSSVILNVLGGGTATFKDTDEITSSTGDWTKYTVDYVVNSVANWTAALEKVVPCHYNYGLFLIVNDGAEDGGAEHGFLRALLLYTPHYVAYGAIGNRANYASMQVASAFLERTDSGGVGSGITFDTANVSGSGNSYTVNFKNNSIDIYECEIPTFDENIMKYLVATTEA